MLFMRDYNKEYQDASETSKYVHDFDVVMRQFMIRAFEPFLRAGAALEIGCYKGDFTRLLLPLFEDLSVIEASSELAKFTQNIMPEHVHFFVCTIENFNDNKKFDTIFLMHTLEHLDDPVGVLGKIKNMLTPNGRLILAVPNANAPSRQIAVKMGLISHNFAVTADERVHGHRKTYSLDTLEAEAKNAGFNIFHRGGVCFKPLANFQMDRALEHKIINHDFLEGCYALGMQYPELCASVFVVCQAP